MPVEVSLIDIRACKLVLLNIPIINRSGIITVEAEPESEGKKKVLLLGTTF